MLIYNLLGLVTDTISQGEADSDLGQGAIDSVLGQGVIDGDLDNHGSRESSISPSHDDYEEIKTPSGVRRVCKHCGKECIKPSDLKRHLMVHTGYKPFKCEVS